jgi:hypothetical protein
MKLLIVFSLSVLTLAAADGQAKKAAAPEAASEPSAQTAPKKPEIPAGAVKSEDGSYRYTDAQGKKWIYRKTPFGIARLEDTPVDTRTRTAGTPDRFENVKATEDGDTIRFERPGPFGTYKWQRKKTELDTMEQSVWDRERARTAARQD